MELGVVKVWLGIGIFFFILTSLAIIDIALKDFGTIGKKAMWGFIALIPFIGCVIYFIFGYRKGKRQS
jgi:hypothetical protein